MQKGIAQYLLVELIKKCNRYNSRCPAPSALIVIVMLLASAPWNRRAKQTFSARSSALQKYGRCRQAQQHASFVTARLTTMHHVRQQLSTATRRMLLGVAAEASGAQKLGAVEDGTKAQQRCLLFALASLRSACLAIIFHVLLSLGLLDFSSLDVCLGTL